MEDGIRASLERQFQTQMEYLSRARIEGNRAELIKVAMALHGMGTQVAALAGEMEGQAQQHKERKSEKR